MVDQTKQNIALLRQQLKSQKLDGLIVPRSDEYLGEYVPAAAERLHWLTGFTGSWGQAVITKTRAALIVDGRYTIQAAKQTKGLSIELLTPEESQLAGFMKAMGKSAKLGFDPWTTSVSEARRLAGLASKSAIELVPTTSNLVDAVWTNRPSLPAGEIYAHPMKYAGATIRSKLEVIAKAISDRQCDCALLTDPHSVAWALNMRGNDITHTPIALLRAIVRKDATCLLFVDKGRCTAEVQASFEGAVQIRSPEKFNDSLKDFGRKKSAVMLDPSLCPEAIKLVLAENGANIVEDRDPCSLPRARKNPTEQRGTRNAHVRDGAALSNFLAWLDANAPTGKLTESAAQDKLHEFRKATGKLVDLSFGSISAAGPNAALPHYHVATKTGRKLGINEIYLIDSGGQYRDGTTDVTRTIILGQPTPAMKKHYTLVLKGMIAVSVARFPVGTSGVQLDALARAALWQNGLDFDHGTGHGVGSFLSVHEGPARISKAGHVPLEPGMILSNEPGFYLKGKYGIRIENLLLVRPLSKPAGGDRAMLSFETLTFAPIDKRLIDQDLLTKAEMHWLDDYHAQVLEKIGRHVNADTLDWLKAACAPLTRKA